LSFSFFIPKGSDKETQKVISRNGAADFRINAPGANAAQIICKVAALVKQSYQVLDVYLHWRLFPRKAEIKRVEQLFLISTL
jgi:hypothetical protein